MPNRRVIRRRKSAERGRIAKGEARAREIVSRRLAGQSFSMIATGMGMALSSVHEGYSRGLNAICPPDSLIEARRRAAARLDELRLKVWPRLKGARPAIDVVMAALKIEERESRLLGLDAALRFTEGSTPVPNADELTAQIQKNLSVEQQRQLVMLLRLAKSGPAPAIEVAVTPIPRTDAEIVEPDSFNLPPSTTPATSAFVGRSDEPSTSFTSLSQFCAEFNLLPNDPTVGALRRQAREAWLAWHQRICTALRSVDCPHKSVLGR